MEYIGGLSAGSPSDIDYKKSQYHTPRPGAKCVSRGCTGKAKSLPTQYSAGTWTNQTRITIEPRPSWYEFIVYRPRSVNAWKTGSFGGLYADRTSYVLPFGRHVSGSQLLPA